MTSDNAEYKLISAEGTEARVCEDIAKRQQLGIAKYGQTVANNPLELRAWLQHAYEETLDKAVYLRRAIEEMDKVKDFEARVDRAVAQWPYR